MKEIFDFFEKIFGKNPLVILSAMVGGVGILNLIDSIIIERLAIQWVLIPDWLRPIFTLLRNWWYPLVDQVLSFLSVNISASLKDYMLMGVIVAGMRLRSSIVIWKAVNDKSLEYYTQKTVFSNLPLTIRENERLKFYGLFLPIRLSYAFVAWPMKIFGAAWRYGRGDWKKGFDNEKSREIRQEQYFTFFGAVFWAVFFILICLIAG